MKFSCYALLISASAAVPLSSGVQTGAQVVDLDYTLHQGNLEANPYGPAFYRFANIQYATASRFGLPQVPPTDRSVVQQGETNIRCPETIPSWSYAIDEYNAGETPVWVNITTANVSSPGTGVQEDCLFLDMLVPEQVYLNQTAKAPVLVWIHGGGYVAGSKAGDGPAGGFEGEGYMTRSNGSVIFLTINYRLGIFGWLAGQSYQENAPTNLGLRDQRFALEWVQKYISRFGGDPDNVLIYGESAGGGAVMNQIIAYGGKNGTPFNHVVPQSPWHQPLTRTRQEDVYQYALQSANVTTFKELQELDFDTFYKVNALATGNVFPFGCFNFQPVPDGDILPGYFTDLFNQGAFNRSLNIMVGHNTNEGYVFTSPFIKTDALYRQWLQDVLTDSSPGTIDYIATVLYPPVYDGSQGYTDEHGRVDATLGDFSVNCNAELMSVDVGRFNGPNSSYAYKFNVPPGYHGEDVGYTMYAEGLSSNSTNATIAFHLQKSILSLLKTGNPNTPGEPNFPYFSPIGYQENLNVSGPAVIPVDNFNRRCIYWSSGAFRY